MNKKLIYALGVLVLVVLGYFALQEETPKTNIMEPLEMQPPGMDQMSEGGLDLVHESVAVPFNETYTIDDEWSLIVTQFEPDAKITDPGTILSDSDQELNPAVKVDFHKNGEFVHYQIVFKEMPGFHSVKVGQLYLLDFIDYKGFKVSGDKKYSIKNANLKVWRIK